MSFSQQRLISTISAAQRIAEAHRKLYEDLTNAVIHAEQHRVPLSALIAEVTIATKNNSIHPNDIHTITLEEAQLKANWKVNERVRRYRERQAMGLPAIHRTYAKRQQFPDRTPIKPRPQAPAKKDYSYLNDVAAEQMVSGLVLPEDLDLNMPPAEAAARGVLSQSELLEIQQAGQESDDPP